MLIGFFCGSTPARGAFQKSASNKVWLDNFFHRGFFLACGCGDGAESDRTAVEFVDDDGEYCTINLRESKLVEVLGEAD